MKATLRKMMIVAAMVVATFSVFAQQLPELTDPNVRIGKLDNGLTYYIRHNEHPKGLANFHIAQRVGAVQEEANQNGLAHFLEHMCFNGTKNFPDKLMLNWLESIGVKFGANLNAYTSTDRTVYEITNVPTARETVVDSCLLILHDWADALTLADAEIEKERGVIHEEWRVGNGAISRILNRNGETLYPGTKYATHNVIGSMDVVDNFEPQVLRDYYEKWYRPDLQGLIIVGDIDVDAVEQKIKEMFSPIKMPENPAKFEYHMVGDNDEPIIVSDKDKEMPINLVFVAQKFDKVPREMRNTDANLVNNYVFYVIGKVLTDRFTDIALSPDAPFGGCSASVDSYLYATTKGALLSQAVVNDKGSEAALRTVLTEFKRMREYGATATEYDRARTEYLSMLENRYNNRATDKNDVYAETYIENFIDNEPIADIDYVYNKMKAILPMIPVEAVNQVAAQLLTDKNLVVLSACVDKEGVKVPTVEELKAVIDEVKAAKVEAYVDNVSNEPLMSQLPTPGKIVKKSENKVLGYTELTLSNGAKVMLKKTDFKDDEIRLKAVSEGGASVYPAADYPCAMLAADVLPTTGLAQFSYTDLQKLLSGKQASVSPYISDYEEGMSGKTTPKDLETMMQLLYLNFTQVREDKAAYETVKNLMLSQVENMSRDPQYVFQDSLVRNLYGHHPKAMIQNYEMFSKMDYDRMVAIYKERFANAADFTFIIAGNFDEAEMEKYVAQYIASLPAKGKAEKAVNDGKAVVKGKVNKTFKQKSESNLAMMAMVWTGDIDYTLENKLKVSIVGQLMANELLNSVREDEGAAYSPYSVGSVGTSYKDYFVIQTAFALNPDKREKSEKATINSLETLAKDIPDTELKKMKEYMLKRYDEQVRENGYWLGVMEDAAMNGIDSYSDYKKIINSLTAEQMEKFVGQLLKQGNRCEVIMLPE